MKTLNFDTAPNDAMVRIGHAAALLGVSRSTLYRQIARGDFPKKQRITAGACGFRLGDLRAWLKSREAA